MGKLASATKHLLGAPLRVLIPKNPWVRLALIAVPVLIVLAFLQPVLSLLGRGLELLVGVFTPLLDNPIGRLVLLNLILLLALAFVWSLLKHRVRALRSGLVLRHHLAGVQAWLQGRHARSRELLEKVARSRAAAPPEYPHAAADARIKLARLALEAGDSDHALAWVTSVRERKLPKELERSLLQLRAEAGLAQGEMLAETLEREVRAALDRVPGDAHLLAALRRLLAERGALAEAADAQEKVVLAVPPRQRPAARQRLVDDYLAAGHAALAAGQLKLALRLARKAHAVEPVPAAGCLLGRIREAEGNAKAAVREWGATGSPEALDLIADLLQRQPEALSPRELLECSPNEGTLLLVARCYARAGERDRALRAARRAARTLGPTPAVTAVLEEVLALCGQPDEALQLREAAVMQLLTQEP